MKKDGRRRTGERKKDGWTDGRAGGRKDGRTDGGQAGGEFREKGEKTMGKVVRFWSRSNLESGQI